MTLVPVPVQLPAIATDMLNKIIGPAVEEAGLAVRDFVRMIRFKRQVRYFERLGETCNKAGFNPRQVKLGLVLDILDRGTIEEDDHLQDLWVNLLANAADPLREDSIPPAFPDILRQLSKEEAIFMQFLFDQAGDRHYVRPRMVRVSEAPPPQLKSFEYDNLERLRLISMPDQDDVFMQRVSELAVLTDLGYEFVKACTAPKLNEG